MITAKCISNRNPYTDKEYPLKEGQSYEVKFIDMGQSHTWISLNGFREPFNSVCFEFFENDKPLNIYRDRRFNPYM